MIIKLSIAWYSSETHCRCACVNRCVHNAHAGGVFKQFNEMYIQAKFKSHLDFS